MYIPGVAFGEVLKNPDTPSSPECLQAGTALYDRASRFLIKCVSGPPTPNWGTPTVPQYPFHHKEEALPRGIREVTRDLLQGHPRPTPHLRIFTAGGFVMYYMTPNPYLKESGPDRIYFLVRGVQYPLTTYHGGVRVTSLHTTVDPEGNTAIQPSEADVQSSSSNWRTSLCIPSKPPMLPDESPRFENNPNGPVARHFWLLDTIIDLAEARYDSVVANMAAAPEGRPLYHAANTDFRERVVGIWATRGYGEPKPAP